MRPRRKSFLDVSVFGGWLRIHDVKYFEMTDMTYQKARLWLGISGVGTLVLFASAGVFLGLPSAWRLGSSDAGVLATVMAIYIAISAPFDWIGGFYLPRRFGRATSSLMTFMTRWLRGVVLHAGVMMLGLALILVAGKAGGLLAATIALVGGMFVLIMVQGLLARWVGTIVKSRTEHSIGGFLGSEQKGKHGKGDIAVCVYESTDPGFTGGIIGLPGAEQVIVPETWCKHLAPQMQEALIRRRHVAADSPARKFGLLAAMLWNLAGFLIAASLLPGADVTTAAGVVTIALGAGLWSFLGLLLLPTASRSAVLAIDRQICRDPEMKTALLANAIHAIHELQDDEPRRGRCIETVFHPIPALENRLAKLADTELGHGDHNNLRPWHLARMTLYLSWACFGFLSRAVHCNSGRPDMWVLLPCD